MRDAANHVVPPRLTGWARGWAFLASLVALLSLFGSVGIASAWPAHARAAMSHSAQSYTYDSTAHPVAEAHGDPAWTRGQRADRSSGAEGRSGFVSDVAVAANTGSKALSDVGDVLKSLPIGADAGTFTAQVGTPLRQRAMRQGAENAPYSVFELQQDITVRRGITAPAFGQPGIGIQYQFPSSMASLLESGAIRRLP